MQKNTILITGDNESSNHISQLMDSLKVDKEASIIVLDKEGDFSDIKKQSYPINPMDLYYDDKSYPGESLNTQFDYCCAFVEVITGLQLTPKQKLGLSKCVIDLYDSYIKRLQKKNCQIDRFDAMSTVQLSDALFFARQENKDMESLADAMSDICNKERLFHIFSHQTKISMDQPYQSFFIPRANERVWEAENSVWALLLFQQAYIQTRANYREKKRTHIVLRSASMDILTGWEDYFWLILKRLRPLGADLAIITGDKSYFESTQTGRCIQNCANYVNA